MQTNTLRKGLQCEIYWWIPKTSVEVSRDYRFKNVPISIQKLFVLVVNVLKTFSRYSIIIGIGD
jgi:hypothetical protein